MIQLNSAIYSKDLRKSGIVLSCVNIFLQVASVVTVIVSYVISAQKRDWYLYEDSSTGPNWFYTQPFRYLLVDAMFFLVLDILLYILLVFGLIRRKVAVLTVWLIFSVFEFLVVQVPLYMTGLIWTVGVNHAMGIIPLIVQILIAVYMYFVACVVFSVRHEILNKENPSNANRTYAHFNANAATVNAPNVLPVQFGVGVPQYTIASQPLVVPATSSTLNHENPPSTTTDQKEQPPAYSM